MKTRKEQELLKPQADKKTS